MHGNEIKPSNKYILDTACMEISRLVGLRKFSLNNKNEKHEAISRIK